MKSIFQKLCHEGDDVENGDVVFLEQMSKSGWPV